MNEYLTTLSFGFIYWNLEIWHGEKQAKGSVSRKNKCIFGGSLKSKSLLYFIQNSHFFITFFCKLHQMKLKYLGYWKNEDISVWHYYLCGSIPSAIQLFGENGSVVSQQKVYQSAIAPTALPLLLQCVSLFPHGEFPQVGQWELHMAVHEEDKISQC